MTDLTTTATWQTANYQYLLASVRSIRQRLEQVADRSHPSAAVHSLDAVQAELQAAIAALPTASALEQLCQIFHLSSFERDLLLLGVGVEIDPAIATLCGTIQGDSQRSYPTLHLALSIFLQPHWSAFTPDGPLRFWRLIEIGSGATLMHSPLRVDERILHYLMGGTSLQRIDARLASTLQPIAPRLNLVASHQQIADRISNLWSQTTHPALVHLHGIEAAGKSAIAATACQQTGRSLYILSALTLPTSPDDLNTLILLWEREAHLSHAALLIDGEGLDVAPTRQTAIVQLIRAIQTPLIVTSRDRDRTLLPDLI